MDERRITITQGELAIDRAQDVCISTILGSCVACCLWDPVEKIGGVNHMLLAGRSVGKGINVLLDINEIELLINGLVRKGAAQDRLVAKVFGGAQMIGTRSNVGELNGRFALDYLSTEGIPCQSHSLGGNSARHLLFWPATGMARQRFANVVPDMPKISSDQTGNGVDFF